jgi:hypothetical protein
MKGRSNAGSSRLWLWTVSLLGLLAGGCSMAGSSAIDLTKTVGCESSVGAYYLSKTYLTVEVHSVTDPTTAKEAFSLQGGIGAVPRPDPKAPYCLDYLGSITSDDTFNVQKNNNLLAKITSVADDQSAVIAEKAIKAIFVGLSGNPEFDRLMKQASRAYGGRLGGALRFRADFDPFDRAELARVNNGMKDFGFCLVFKEQTFPHHASIDEYCENPMGPSAHEPWHASVRRGRPPAARPVVKREAPPPYTQGIFYRPRLPYSLLLFTKENLRIPGGWQLRGSDTLMLENEAPVFSVGIDRAFFTKRETRLIFSDGQLQDVTIDKGSELAGFVGIPLQIAQSIVALPTNIIQVRINQTNSRNQLIAAQTQLIQAEKQLLEQQKLLDAEQAKAPPAAARSGDLADSAFGGDAANGSNGSFAAPRSTPGAVAACTSDCVNGGKGGEISCQKFCSCKIQTCVLGSESACNASCLRQLNGT